MTATQTVATHQTAAAPHDAIALRKADHAAVGPLFAGYAKTRSASDKQARVAEICTALSMHAHIEEEIFHPAVKDALKDKLLVPGARVEHGSVKDHRLAQAA